jgi:tRNA dimethylallyltransferase
MAEAGMNGIEHLPLIVLVGPTAVGKTDLSFDLCARFGGEIIGADSRQIYRGMDIGTAKPTVAELTRLPHHLIDIRDPDQVLTLAEFQRLAYAAIDDIHRRNALPFLVGGSALYLRSVVQGLRIPEVPPDPQIRAELEAVLARDGRDALFHRLQAADPATAAVIDPKNHRRVLRALEIFLVTGRSKVSLEGMDPPPYRMLQIGLDRPRPSLYERVDGRVDAMLEAGLVAETERLLAAGYGPELPSMTSLGYREISAYLAGEMSLDSAIVKIKHETHRFVRHQYTWFRKLPDIEWFDLEQCRPDDIVLRVERFLAD